MVGLEGGQGIHEKCQTKVKRSTSGQLTIVKTTFTTILIKRSILIQVVWDSRSITCINIQHFFITNYEL